MENLTKHQIILLTLLVSFVTSMATGIVAVSLMNQAPAGVTQTINRVVERTIEKVITPSNQNNNQSQTVVKETLVVNADDQIVKSIDKNSKSLVRIYRTSDDTLSPGPESMNLVGIGAVVTDDLIIATDRSIIAEGGNYFASSGDGQLRKLSIVRAVSGEQIALMKIKSDDKNPLVLPKVALSSEGDLKLGQTVIYIGGEIKNIVGTGIVSSLGTKEIKIENTASSTGATSSAESTQTVVTSIETTIQEGSFVTGGFLLNLSGELVGIKSTYLDTAKTDLFAPSSDIQYALDKLAVTQTP